MDYEINEGFTIDNDLKANWALKKIKEAEFEHDRLMEIVNAEREELRKKEEELDKKLEDSTGYMKSLLWQYFKVVAHKETKTQESYKLLDGSLVWKKPSVSISRPDDEALIDYLKQSHPEMVEVIQKPKWGDFKKTLTITEDGAIVTDDGEVLDFITTEDKEGEFNVK